VFADAATLSVIVTGGVGTTLQVIKNGAVVESESVISDLFTHEMSVEAPAEGEDRYRHQLMMGLDARTIGSYVWLRAADGPEPGESSSGCSCRVVGPSDHDTGFVLALLAFGAWYWRRRRAS
jgi:MYXO-CTERM domain-containing protein